MTNTQSLKLNFIVDGKSDIESSFSESFDEDEEDNKDLLTAVNPGATKSNFRKSANTSKQMVMFSQKYPKNRPESTKVSASESYLEKRNNHI